MRLRKRFEYNSWLRHSSEARVKLRKERKWKLSVVAIVIQILCLAWPPDRLKESPWPEMRSRSKVIKRVLGYAAGGARARRCHARIVGRFRDFVFLFVVRMKKRRIDKSDHGLLCWLQDERHQNNEQMPISKTKKVSRDIPIAPFGRRQSNQ